MKLDLSGLDSVKECCTEFLQKEDKLHILVNNGGMDNIIHAHSMKSQMAPSIFITPLNVCKPRGTDCFSIGKWGTRFFITHAKVQRGEGYQNKMTGITNRWPPPVKK